MDDRPLATAIGERLRAARKRAGLTQQSLAGARYTKAYVSALETGAAKPSMAALSYLADRLGLPASVLVADVDTAWTRLEADLRLASGDFEAALDAYRDLAETAAPKAERAHTYAGMAEALCRLDRGSEAIRPATEAVAVYEELGRTRERATALYWLAYGHHMADNPDEARALMRQVLDSARVGPAADPELAVRALIALGVIEAGAGRPDAALAYLQEADGLAVDLDARRRATFLHALAIGYRQVGDLEGAIRTGTQSLALFRNVEARHEAASIANHLALAYLDSGSTSRALDMARAGRAASEGAGDDWLLAYIADTEARIAMATGDLPAAERLADEAISLADRTSNRKALLDGLVTKARIEVAAGRVEEAAELYGKAAEIARAAGSVARRRDVLSAWADTLARAGHHDRAYELMREALQANA